MTMLRSVNSDESAREYDFISAANFDHLTDTEIIDRILSGQTSLFEVLMRRYNERLFRIQRSYISDEEAVKDTLQQTYLKAFKNLDSFKGDSQFSTWITRIAINEALKYLNKQNRYSRIHDLNEDIPQNSHTVDTRNTPEKDMIQSDFRGLLEDAVDQLSPKYRSVYMLREVEQINTKETADCLDISRSNVKVRLHRAKKMVRKELERKVADTDIFNFKGLRCDRMVLQVMTEINDLERE